MRINGACESRCRFFNHCTTEHYSPAKIILYVTGDLFFQKKNYICSLEVKTIKQRTIII